MQVRKWLISGEINYNVCRICSLTLLPPEVLIPTPITLSVLGSSKQNCDWHIFTVSILL